MCLLHAHDDCTHRFAKRDSGDDGAEVWDHNAWTGQDECLLVTLQTELEQRIAKDSEAIVFEQKARKFFLAWRQVGAGRDEHAKVCSLCWPLLSDYQHWAAVAMAPDFVCKRNPNLPRIRSFVRITFKCNPNLSQIRSTFHRHATQTVRISSKHRWWNGRGEGVHTQRCMCGGGPHTEGAGVEEVHMTGSTKRTTISDHPNTRQTTVSMDMLEPT